MPNYKIYYLHTQKITKIAAEVNDDESTKYDFHKNTAFTCYT